jgi:hypothetical protein
MRQSPTPSPLLLLAMSPAEPFTVENDMLTQKMSIKRHNVVKAYAAAIDDLYASPETSTQRTTSKAARRPKAPSRDGDQSIRPLPV